MRTLPREGSPVRVAANIVGQEYRIQGLLDPVSFAIREGVEFIEPDEVLGRRENKEREVK
jgi:hypothetical protein